VVVLVLLVAAAGGGAAVLQVGASALQVSGGFSSSDIWSPGAQWAGIELENRSGSPLTLRAVSARDAANVEILDVRVIDPDSSHLLQLGVPLEPDLQTVVDRSQPLAGFVLPPHSRGRYEIAIRFRPRSTGQAVLSTIAVVYSAWGLDHGAVSDGVYCVRAPGKDTCPPY
jgi:hypothetical protein